MSRSPQDVYARYLSSSRGYPLWVPEPSHQLLLSRQDGLRIGDVGVVVPEDGGFDVFFNICLPREHPFHRATGVPDNFDHVELHDEDIRVIPRVENPGRIISTSSVTKIKKIEPHRDTPGAQLGGLGYEFELSSSGGALLILPEGAERYDLRNRRLFFEEATRHGVDWYRFAEERLGRMISNDSLYLITGFYKTYSWSLAAFENVAGSGDFSAQFKMAQGGGSNIAGTYTWETTRALDWRAGPAENNGLANQSVFIRGFKIALRTGFLRKKWIEVKATEPSTSSDHGRFSQVVKSWVSNVRKGFWRGSGAGTDMRDEVMTEPITHQASESYLSAGSLCDAGKHVVIQPMPEIPEYQMFHPSDIINRYLLQREASANVAITHDDDWTILLEKGLLNSEDFVQANALRLEDAVTNNFHVVSQEGVVFLQEERPTSVEKRESRAVQAEQFNLPLDVEAPPPAYSKVIPDRDNVLEVSEKSQLLTKPLDSAPVRLLGIHWLLLPYDPPISKHPLRFDVMFPVDQICYQYNDARERVPDDDLDEPASDEPITKMRITFEQRPFNWTIDVDNPNRIRCRDVFQAIYDSFDQQLTLDELWRVTNRSACEDAFRIRNLARGNPQIERSLGWKRVDVLLHHTIFQGLTMNQEGGWILHLGVPLPASDLPRSPSLARRDSSSTEESSESSNEFAYLPSRPTLRGRGSLFGPAGSAEDSASHAAPLVTTPVLLPRQQFTRSRPNRPLGPRPQPNR